jgi:signal transduction histidine kinase
MSCAMPSNDVLESGASVGDAESYAWVCRELGDGLHALAQPLTILRGALGALTMRDAVRPEAASRYLEMSNTQVERLCDLLSDLQNLLGGIRSEPARTKIEPAVLDEQERITEMANYHTPVNES